ncbi:LLM class flavin-dependent oxidoreductase [Cryptosporangium sp. NPDC048952]|uniref:LLM class flavin-dependent oxidoreductase n=1 Tax=Cryptosporangium sp. NPDC048952 TaxID=3363961 RepID=UPI00371C7AD3
MAAKEYGIFLPIGSGGWMLSTTAPHPEATYAYNKRAAMHAEAIGLDFIMSMAKWRGFGGTTDHWGESLESMTMMAALAEATENVKIWATVHANVHNPGIAAKMFTTLQQISGGRAGMNIVNGAYAAEFAQYGLWSDLSKEDRYRMTAEWTDAVLRLWSEDSVTLDGEFYQLREAESRPHPAVRPTIISAGQSPAGRAFQAAYADGAFLSARAWAEGATGSAVFQTPYVSGSTDTVVEHIRTIVREAELDGLMLIFPEYDEDMLRFGETVLPQLRKLDED